MIRLSPLAPLLMLACSSVEVAWPEVQPGAPLAGAAERTLDLPVGTPLGGFSARSTLLGSSSRPDPRRTHYITGFAPSAGVQTRPTLKVIWLHNDDEHLVLIKADLIYSNDHYVEDVARELGSRLGLDLEGRVTISTSHTHQSYGPFSDQFHFYLGGDRFHPEIYARLLDETVEVAERAWNSREEVQIGSGWAKDWDPDDRVYRDRRSENDDLQIWDDAEPGYGKDPYLHMLRIDRLDGTPMAFAFTFGIHGTVVGQSSPMISTDAPGHVEVAVQDAFPEPVVAMHLQGSGGDASPGGRGARLARLESIGERAVDAIVDLWDATPTSDAPITIETVSRHIPQFHSQIRVTRNGTVDWHYAPLTDNPMPDEQIYDENGDIISPIDEFNAPYGAAFCGSDAPLIPAGNIGSEVFPYSACMDVELVSRILYAVFNIDEGEIPLPLPETLKAGTTASLLGPLPTLTPSGEERSEPLYVGFFPGEPTGTYGEQFRRRAHAELDHPHALLVGYAQDHEGYLMIPEDWLLGGYEPNINVWGPLQGEHIMEGVLDMSAEYLGNGLHGRPGVGSAFAPTRYPDRPKVPLSPDRTPSAGTALTEAPEPPLWTPDDFEVDLDIPAEVPRVQGLVQFAWQGGDARVDLPTVTLQRLDGEDWVPATTRSGRPITDAFHDLLMTWTPDPLFPVTALQTHRWWIVWQAVDHVSDKAGLPLGTYRFKVDGHHFTGDEEVWPFTTEPYDLTSPSFEIVPAALQIDATEGGVLASLPGPSRGYRMIHDDGEARGHNPLTGPLRVWIGDDEVHPEGITRVGSRTFVPLDVTGAVYIEDAYGNAGLLEPR